MKQLATLAIALSLFGLANIARAADDEKPNPTGTWKWSTKNAKTNQTSETVLKLKLDGDKLTGHIVGRNDRENKIKDATYKDGEVSFSVAQGRKDASVTRKFKGKVKGDKITGKIEFERDGKPRSRDWEAKRETEKEKPA